MQLWSYFIGILGHDDVTFGGVTAPARVGPLAEVGGWARRTTG